MTTDIDCAFISALLLRPANRKTLKWIVQNSSTLIYIKEDDEMVRHTDIRVAFSKFCRRPFISSVFPQEFVEIEKKDQLYYLRTALPFLKSASDGPKERLFEICRSKGLIKSVTVAELANDVEVTISISTAG